MKTNEDELIALLLTKNGKIQHKSIGKEELWTKLRIVNWIDILVLFFVWFKNIDFKGDSNKKK